jgi:FkbM family methyltransferase
MFKRKKSINKMNLFSDMRQVSTFSRSEYEQACIDNTDHSYMGDATILCKVLTRYKMYVDARDMGIAPHLIMDGFWESWVTRLLGNIVKPGHVCLDVGANFGYFSILMSELAGTSGRTIAFEPNPRVASLLKSTAFVNGNKFEVAQVAVSDKNGEAIFTVTDKELGGGTIQKNTPGANRSQYTVPTISIDELVNSKGIKKVDIVKIDVEGVEPLVFAGMEKTIAANPGIQIIVEYTPSIYADARQFTEYLFSRFNVQQISDVDELKQLDRNSITSLLEIRDHADLYLQRNDVAK